MEDIDRLSAGRIDVREYTAYEPRFSGYALIAVALSTDFLDGYLARRQGLKTPLGLILDPTADKILISSLAILGVLFKGLPTWMAAVIVGKDAVVFSGAALIFLRRGLVLPSDRWGRITTVVASIALGLYFLFPRSLGPYAVGLLICCIPLSVGAYGTRFIRLLRASGPTTSSAR